MEVELRQPIPDSFEERADLFADEVNKAFNFEVMVENHTKDALDVLDPSIEFFKDTGTDDETLKLIEQSTEYIREQSLTENEVKVHIPEGVSQYLVKTAIRVNMMATRLGGVLTEALLYKAEESPYQTVSLTYIFKAKDTDFSWLLGRY